MSKYPNYNLFDSQWWLDYSYEEYKSQMEDNGFKVNEEGSHDYWYDINQMTTDDWDNMFCNLKYSKYANEKVMITGCIGRWNGTFDIKPALCNNVMDAIEKCVGGSDDCEINMVDGHIEVIGKHHDGSNYFEIHFLSKKGFNAIDKCIYEYKDYDVKPWWFRKIKGYIY